MQIIQWSDEMVWSVIIVFVLIVMDYGTGIIKALKNKNLSSAIMRDGLWHKIGFIAAVALAIIVEIGAEHLNLPFNVPILISVCVYIILTEITSILENIGEINPELKTTKFLSYFDTNDTNTKHRK